MHELKLQRGRLRKLANYLIKHASQIQIPESSTEHLEFRGGEEYMEVRVAFFDWALLCLPDIFPDDWEQGSPYPILWGTKNPFVYNLILFLGLPNDFIFQLFVPLAQTESYLSILFDDATPEQIGQNILELLKHKNNENNKTN